MSQVERSIQIRDGHDPRLVPLVRGIFLEYATWLGVDLCFQGFEKELASLPGQYAPPSGALLLAWAGEKLAGCIAMRPLEPGVCEMKRLWVREDFRGQRVGDALVQTILHRAQAAGYERMRLDTLPQMKSAIGLYRRSGFREIDAYYGNPLPGVIYLEKDLVAPRAAVPADL